MKNVVTLTVRIKLSVERGLDMKFKRPKPLIIMPKSIRKAILNPTENNKVSTKLNSLKLSILKRIRPGINVKQRKPKHCLANGISRKMEIKNIA